MKLIFTLSILFFAPFSYAQDCAKSFTKFSDKELALPGTVIEIIEPKTWYFKEPGCVFMPVGGGGGLGKTFKALPGARFEILAAPEEKTQGIMGLKVKHLESGTEGEFYWIDIKGRAKIVSSPAATSAPVVESSAKKFDKPMFVGVFKASADPNIGHRGRRLPKLGDFVYFGSNRVMSPGTVGEVIEANSSSVTVKLLNGKQDQTWIQNASPLTPEELQQVKSYYHISD